MVWAINNQHENILDFCFLAATYDCPCPMSMFIVSLTLAFKMAHALTKAKEWLKGKQAFFFPFPSPRVVLFLAAPSLFEHSLSLLWLVMTKERRRSRPEGSSRARHSCLTPALLTCSAVQGAHYCSRAHQHSYWPIHKASCAAFVCSETPLQRDGTLEVPVSNVEPKSMGRW